MTDWCALHVCPVDVCFVVFLPTCPPRMECSDDERHVCGDHTHKPHLKEEAGVVDTRRSHVKRTHHRRFFFICTCCVCRSSNTFPNMCWMFAIVRNVHHIIMCFVELLALNDRMHGQHILKFNYKTHLQHTEVKSIIMCS